MGMAEHACLNLPACPRLGYDDRREGVDPQSLTRVAGVEPHLLSELLVAPARALLCFPPERLPRPRVPALADLPRLRLVAAERRPPARLFEPDPIPDFGPREETPGRLRRTDFMRLVAIRLILSSLPAGGSRSGGSDGTPRQG